MVIDWSSCRIGLGLSRKGKGSNLGSVTHRASNSDARLMLGSAVEENRTQIRVTNYGNRIKNCNLIVKVVIEYLEEYVFLKNTG